MKKVLVLALASIVGYAMIAGISEEFRQAAFKDEVRAFQDNSEKTFANQVYSLATRDGCLSEFERGEYFARLDRLNREKTWLDSHRNISHEIMRQMYHHCSDELFKSWNKEESPAPQGDEWEVLVRQEFTKRYSELSNIDLLLTKLTNDVRFADEKSLQERQAAYAQLKKELSHLLAKK